MDDDLKRLLEESEEEIQKEREATKARSGRVKIERMFNFSSDLGVGSASGIIMRLLAYKKIVHREHWWKGAEGKAFRYNCTCPADQHLQRFSLCPICDFLAKHPEYQSNRLALQENDYQMLLIGKLVPVKTATGRVVEIEFSPDPYIGKMKYAIMRQLLKDEETDEVRDGNPEWPKNAPAETRGKLIFHNFYVWKERIGETAKDVRYHVGYHSTGERLPKLGVDETGAEVPINYDLLTKLWQQAEEVAKPGDPEKAKSFLDFSFGKIGNVDDTDGDSIPGEESGDEPAAVAAGGDMELPDDVF